MKSVVLDVEDVKQDIENVARMGFIYTAAPLFILQLLRQHRRDTCCFQVYRHFWKPMERAITPSG